MLRIWTWLDRVLLAWKPKFAAEGRSEVVPGEDDETPFLAMIPFNVEMSEVLDLVRELRQSGFVLNLNYVQERLAKDGLGR